MLVDLPIELLESVAAALDPPALLSLLCSSSALYQSLAPRHNPQLYARLFHEAFDVAAIVRRQGLPSATLLCHEYCARLLLLRRLRSCKSLTDVPPQEELEKLLWSVYMIILEHDSENVPQLLENGKLHDFLILLWKFHFNYVSYTPTNSEYPPDTIDRSLALHIGYLLHIQDNLPRHFARSSCLKPYTFAAYKYDSFLAPWTYAHLPMGSAERRTPPNTNFDEQDPSLVADNTLRPRTCRVNHLGKDMSISPPLISMTALLEFFDIESGEGDETEFPLFDLRRRGGNETSTNVRMSRPALASSVHDFELERLLACHNSLSSPGLSWQRHRNLFQGTWEGRFCFFDFEHYRSMLGGNMRYLDNGNYSLQPQVWKLKETVVRLRPSHRRTRLSPWISDSDEYDKLSGAVTPAKLVNSVPSEDDKILDENDDDDDAESEIVLTGTGHSAWGQFTLTGRVRSWDGLFTILKKYVPDTRGVWVYRGYYDSPTGSLVGRWRDTFTSLDLHGYEGTFSLSRRR